MDSKYIESEHVVDRYLSGDLTVREARDFEQYCLDHPDFLAGLPIPVRLKTRLGRRPPQEETETGSFTASPSSTTRAALEATEDGFDPEEEREHIRSYSGGGVNRIVVIALALALLAALGGVVAYGMQANSLSKQLQQAKRDLSATQMQAPGSVQTYRVAPVRGKPEQATLALGWQQPAQLIDLHVDVSEGKYTQFQITIDKSDGSRVMQIRRIARDSNRELRFAVNSSAFGPGDYLVKIDGYTWRGQPEEIGWLRLGLQ
jgi:hypothetical protein